LPTPITAKFTFFAQLAEDVDVAPPNSEHSAESGAILWHKVPRVTLDAFAKIRAVQSNSW
jgi:hypothetical protein